MSDNAIQIGALGNFEGEDVLTTTIAIVNAGDGLSEALAVTGTILHIGDKVHVVLECEVTEIAFVPIKKTNALNRKAKLRAGDAAIADEQTVRDLLDKTRIAIEERAGISRLDFQRDPDAPDNPDGDGEVVDIEKKPAKRTRARKPADPGV